MLNHYPLPSLMAQERTKPMFLHDLAIADVYDERYNAKDEEFGATVTRRSSWTGGNPEGYTGSPASSARRCLAGPLVVTLWRPAGTSPRMLPEPTIAKFKVEGYATFSSLFLKFTVVSGNSVYRVVLSLRRIPKRLQLKFQTRTKRRIEERVVKSQTKIQPCMN